MRLYRQVLNLDFFLIITFLFLGIFLWINRSTEQELNGRIKRSIIFIMLLAAVENVEVYCAGMSTPSPLYKIAVLTESLLWVSSLMFSLMVVRTKALSKKEKIWLYLPAVINALVVVPGFFSDYLVWVDQANVLHRQTLSYIPLLLGMSYFVFLFRLAREHGLRGFREEATILMVGDFVILFGALMETSMAIHGIMASAITLTLTFYYLYLHMDHSKRDMLTGALTRACFFSDLDKIKQEQLTAFCEFDMNNLKKINDQQGHQAGDDAIVYMYRLILSCLPVNSHVYRFGGDEFVVLFFNVNMSTVYGTIYNIREKFAESEYGCAIGIAEWKEDSTFQEIYNAADQEMYEDKKRQKAGRDMVEADA